MRTQTLLTSALLIICEPMLDCTPAQEFTQISVKEEQQKPITLETCLEIALDNSPMSRAAQEGIKIAEGDVGKAQAAFYPSLEVQAHYNRLQTHAFLPNSPLFNGVPTFIGPTNDWKGGIAGSYLLFDSGRRQALLNAANALHASAREDAQKILHEIALQVTVSYYTLAAQKQIAAVSRVQMERSNQHLQLAQQRKDVGAIPRSDLLRVEVEGAEARQAYARSESDLLIAMGRLNLAMGLPPETPLCIASEKERHTETVNDNLDTAIATALTLRPEVLAAKERLRALTQQICAVKGAIGPKIAAQGLYGYRDIVFPPKDKDWALGVCLEWPIAFGQLSQAPVNQARAQWAKAQAEFEQLMLQIRQQVWDAHARMKAAAENIQMSASRLENARETVRLIEERYRTDAATTNDLLDAQTILARAEAAAVESQWNYRITEVMYLWAQGVLCHSY